MNGFRFQVQSFKSKEQAWCLRYIRKFAFITRSAWQVKRLNNFCFCFSPWSPCAPWWIISFGFRVSGFKSMDSRLDIFRFCSCSSPNSQHSWLILFLSSRSLRFVPIRTIRKNSQHSCSKSVPCLSDIFLTTMSLISPFSCDSMSLSLAKRPDTGS